MPFDDRAHRVLADAEARCCGRRSVPARTCAAPASVGVGRAAEVGGAADQRRRVRRERAASPCRRAARVAMAVARLEAGSASSQPRGSSPRRSRLSSAASVGEGLAPALRRRSSHSRSSSAPRSAARPCARDTSSGTRTSGRIPAERLLRQRDLVLAERRAVRLRRVLPFGAPDSRSWRAQRRSATAARSRRAPRERRVERPRSFAVLDVLDVPAVRVEARRHVLGHERERRRAVERDVVGVVEVDQLAEAEVAGERRGLGETPSIRSPSEQIAYVW